MHPISVRFRDAAVPPRLKAEADGRGLSASGLAEELIDEGLRLRRHPAITFRDGATGRRAALVGGPDVWEVIGGLLGGDLAPDGRVQRAVDLFQLRRDQVEAALAYYAEFTDKIDGRIAANAATAEEAEGLWERQQRLLTK
ncbi:MAG: hypothetical protein ACRDJU_14365 [Actinomycetota bacterium]